MRSRSQDRGDLLTAKRTPTLVDRRPQHLPVPLGGMVPVRVTARRHLRAPHLDMARLCVALGALGGMAGLVLWLAPAPVGVSLVGDRLEVGGMVLTATGPTGKASLLLYGGDASYALAEHDDGSASAAAAWVSRGTQSSGTCAMRVDGSRLIDECTFTTGASVSSAVDILDPAVGPVWQRTYADGVRVDIPVSSAGGAVPVPFPVGRP